MIQFLTLWNHDELFKLLITNKYNTKIPNPLRLSILLQNISYMEVSLDSEDLRNTIPKYVPHKLISLNAWGGRNNPN